MELGAIKNMAEYEAAMLPIVVFLLLVALALSAKLLL
jgi:hypothetical protein